MRKPHRPYLSIAIGMLLVVLICCSGALYAAKEAKPDAAFAKHSDDAKSDVGGDDFLASLDGGDEKVETAKESPVYVTALGFLFKLALVLALAYVTILALKRFTSLRAPLGVDQRRIRVLENSPLGANRMLHLIEVGSKRLLVASTPSQVNLVTEIAPEDVPDVPVGQPSVGFKDHLALFMGGPDSTPYARSVAAMLADSSAFLQDKMRELGRIRGKFRDVQ